MDRPLGVFEDALARTAERSPLNAVCILRLSARPELDRLRRGLDVLRRRHPLLRARIVARGGRRRFVLDAPSVLLGERPRPDDERWLAVAEEEVNRPFDVARGPLARLILVGAGADQPCELVLTLHHSIMDGASVLGLFRDLLEHAAGTADAAAPEPQGPPPPVEALFPPRFRAPRRFGAILGFLAGEMADEARVGWATRREEPVPVPVEVRGRVLTVETPAAVAGALARAARRRGRTLGGLLHAATLLAVSKHLSGGRRLPMRYMTFANLRPYLDPPQDDAALVPYFSMMRFTATVGAEMDVWDLAQAIDAQSARAARRDVKFLSVLLSRLSVRVGAWRRARMATVGLSFLGNVRLDGNFGPLRVLGVHAFVSNVALGPLLAVQARLFAGSLCWDILHLDADMDRATALRITEEILRCLDEAAASPAPSRDDRRGVA
jgi:hypothetical protein